MNEGMPSRIRPGVIEKRARKLLSHNLIHGLLSRGWAGVVYIRIWKSLVRFLLVSDMSRYIYRGDLENQFRCPGMP